jgi:hypothetical protein
MIGISQILFKSALAMLTNYNLEFNNWPLKIFLPSHNYPFEQLLLCGTHKILTLKQFNICYGLVDRGSIPGRGKEGIFFSGTASRPALEPT